MHKPHSGSWGDTVRVGMPVAVVAIVRRPVDGDSVWLEPVDPAGPQFIARIGGVNTPSSGDRATAGEQLIASWEGRRVDFRETCCGRPHGEIPGIITDRGTGENLGQLLLAQGYASRLWRFPIASLPNLSMCAF